MTAAAIDIGTNSIKIAIGAMEPDGSIRLLHHASAITRLGEGVDSAGRISPQGLTRTIEASRELLDMSRDFRVDKIRIVGTSALRDASNQAEVIGRFKDDLNITLEILSEQDECRLSYLAAACDPTLNCFDGAQLTFDIGGGSTELTIGSGCKVRLTKSLKLGAVRLTERYLTNDPPTDEQMRAAESCVDQTLTKAASDTRVDRAIGIGGSIINLARICRGIPIEQAEEVHGTTMSLADVQNLRNKMASLPMTERRSIVGLDPERADIIIAGAIIVERVMHAFGTNEVLVSVRGLRHGVLREMLQEAC
ncbi:MAG: hypothetical protein ABFD49_09835 [Armatimonadota bacterium]|nr:hypothetical protein [bacterium]